MQAWDGVDGGKIGLAGYSFGTRVILAHPEVQKKPRVFAFISPSLEALETATLKKDKRPKLIISGDRDKLLQSEKLAPVLDSFATPPVLKRIKGADHYWMGMEDILVKEVSRFFAENLT
jgi:alpha/beta superfamily hydrolase